MPNLPASPLQTLLQERLQSARGLGWDGEVAAHSAAHSRTPDLNPPRPLSCKGGSDRGRDRAPAWFRLGYLALRSLGLARG